MKYIKWHKILMDLLLWAMGMAICTLWRVAADKVEVWYYIYLFLGMMGVWIVTGLIVGRYITVLHRSFRMGALSWALTVGVTGLACAVAMPLTSHVLSPVVAYWMLGIMAVLSLLYLLGAYYWKYALDIDDEPIKVPDREVAHVAKEAHERSEEAEEAIEATVREYVGEPILLLLKEKASLNSTNTKVVQNRELFSIQQLQDYRYSTIIDLTPMNDVRGINKRYCTINQKLPDEGRLVCCFVPEEVEAERRLQRWPVGIRWVMYTVYFLTKRVLPKLMFTSRLYYDTTGGHNRLISETEALGRLYYCGFRVEGLEQIGDMHYIFAVRDKMPQPQERRLYGPLIKLPRVGKNREVTYYYKLRTMHPYAEYIQKYVYDRNGTNDGDKAENDFRITSWGHVFRRLWIDELPMLFNLLKGDLKLVGVRPLSRVKFDTYPDWLQDLRTKAKPGLIPPFYVDMPKTQDEMFESEARYMRAYLKHPLRTDFVYFWRALYMILIKRARSK